MGKIPMVTTLCQMSDHVTTSDGCASANLSLQAIKKNFPLIIISETCGLMVRCVQVKEVTVCLQKVNRPESFSILLLPPVTLPPATVKFY